MNKTLALWLMLGVWRTLLADLPELQWKHAYPDPTGQWLTSATWGPPGFVVAGWRGERLFSEDAEHWERIASHAPNHFSITHKVCYDAGRYLAIENIGGISWSTNGRDWHVAGAVTNLELNFCAAGDGKYIAIARHQTLLVSTNAQEWESRTIPADFIGLAYGSNTWVAITDLSELYTSSDLMNWTRTFTPSSDDPTFRTGFKTVCFGQGTFIVGGGYYWVSVGNAIYQGPAILRSFDGRSWAFVEPDEVPEVDEIRNSVFANGQFVLASTGGSFFSPTFLISTNGQSWKSSSIPPGNPDLKGIAGSSTGRFVAVGDLGTILVSDDALGWKPITSNPRKSLYSIAYAEGRYVAVGGETDYIGGPSGSAVVMTSTNGQDWQPSLTNNNNQLAAVAYGNGVWVVCGYYGQVFSSSNALDWADHTFPPLSGGFDRLAFGNGHFVALSSYSGARTYHSTNGTDWVSVEGPLIPDISKLQFVNGQFMAVSGGTILTSDDGLTWSATNAFPNQGLTTFTYGKGRYVVGGPSFVGYSLDGKSWTGQPVPMLIFDLGYADGWFIAIGFGSEMLISRDGVQWETVTDPLINEGELDTMAFGNGQIVIVSWVSLYCSPWLDRESYQSRLHLLLPSQFEFYGRNGLEYRLEQTTNLVQWTPASDWSTGSNQYILWNAEPFSDPAKFWRATGRVLQP